MVALRGANEMESSRIRKCELHTHTRMRNMVQQLDNQLLARLYAPGVCASVWRIGMPAAIHR